LQNDFSFMRQVIANIGAPHGNRTRISAVKEQQIRVGVLEPGLFEGNSDRTGSTGRAGEASRAPTSYFSDLVLAAGANSAYAWMPLIVGTDGRVGSNTSRPPPTVTASQGCGDIARAL
jgi:hypothetical protein